MPKAINFCFRQETSGVHKLYIYDDITAYGKFNWNTWEMDESRTSAEYFREQLAAIPDTDTIELHINSNGGAVKEGVAIYNQLKQKECKKTGYVDGVAYSVAFIVLQACDYRVMGIGTSALIHDMWLEIAGNARELRKAADDLDVLMEANRKIFMERSNLDEQQLIEMMAAETFLTPNQCLEYGLIDEIGPYRTEGQETQEALRERLKQLNGTLSMQKSFREQLEQLTGIRGQGMPGPLESESREGQREPEQQKEQLMERLGNMFKRI